MFSCLRFEQKTKKKKKVFLGPIGSVCSGILASFLEKKGIVFAYVLVALIFKGLLGVVQIGRGLFAEPLVSLYFASCCYFLEGGAFAMSITVLHRITSKEIRSIVSGLLMFSTAFGSFVGPLITGILIDHVFHNRLDIGLVVISGAAIVPGIIFFALCFLEFRTILSQERDQIEGDESTEELSTY